MLNLTEFRGQVSLKERFGQQPVNTRHLFRVKFMKIKILGTGKLEEGQQNMKKKGSQVGSPIKRHLSREKNIPAVRKVSFSRSGLSESCEISVPEGFIFFLPIS